MKALTFHFSYPRFVAGKIFGGLSRGGPLVYEDVPDAKLLGDDWVIVETRYCGICGSDVKQAYLEGAFDNPRTAVISFPHVLGHEVVGTVFEAGKDVRHVKKGDRVACYPWITCAVRGLPPCAACAAGDLALCQNFAGGRFSAGIHHGTCCDLSGGFATHMPAHESACFPIPSDVTFEEAARPSCSPKLTRMLTETNPTLTGAADCPDPHQSQQRESMSGSGYPKFKNDSGVPA